MAKRRPPEPAPTPPEVSHDDLELFAREVAGDRPLAHDPKGRVRLSSEPRVFPGPSEVEGSPEDLDSYVAPGVDRRELRKLKRGDYIPDLRIDLHGLMATEAVARVTRVLEAGPGRRPRCLCVVHGRGLHSAGNVAVLKLRVRTALRAHPVVLAFADAPKTDGGAGAVYVLLRR